LAELLWRQGRPYGVRDGVVLSGIRFEASEVVEEAQSRGVESSGGERIEWKIIGDFTSCFIHEQGINELAFLQTANEPNLAFSGQNWPFQAFLVRLPSDGRNCSGRANQGQGGWTLHSRT